MNYLHVMLYLVCIFNGVYLFSCWEWYLIALLSKLCIQRLPHTLHKGDRNRHFSSKG